MLVDQPVTAEVRESLRLFAAFGAEVVDARTVPGAVRHGARVLARSWLRGERPYLVPTGGYERRPATSASSPRRLELAEQVRAGALPEPAALFLPVGSGGSVAGVALGAAPRRASRRASSACS